MLGLPDPTGVGDASGGDLGVAGDPTSTESWRDDHDRGTFPINWGVGRKITEISMVHGFQNAM